MPKQTQTTLEYKPLSRPMRIGLFILGSLSTALVFIGAVLPLLPSTPFAILALLCYGRSSEKRYQQLLNSPLIGHSYQQLRAGRGLSLRLKLSTLALAWLLLSLSALFLTDSPVLRAFLIGIAITKTFVMFKIKTLTPATDAQARPS
ncbi:MAG: YbaN family protein [Anaerolineales bacterium]